MKLLAPLYLANDGSFCAIMFFYFTYSTMLYYDEDNTNLASFNNLVVKLSSEGVHCFVYNGRLSLIGVSISTLFLNQCPVLVGIITCYAKRGPNYGSKVWTLKLTWSDCCWRKGKYKKIRLTDKWFVRKRHQKIRTFSLPISS